MVSETVRLKQENVKKEAETIGVLKKIENNYAYQCNMINDVSEEQILRMSREEYLTLISGIEDTAIHGEVIAGIHNDTTVAGTRLGEHYDMCASLNTVCASGSSGYLSVSQSKSEWFPNRVKYTEEYRIVDELHKQIEFIESYLESHLPEFLGDFRSFIEKYLAFRDDSSKYQDLIGARSMFFWKMIFEFAKQNYGFETPRIAAIEVFVFGSTDPPAHAQPAIRTAANVYDKYSMQEDGLPSIKAGNVDPSYIETMFRRLIGSIASLLQLREKYFR